jgi:hypothetical protein
MTQAQVSATGMFTKGAAAEEGDVVLSWCEDDGQEDPSTSGRVRPAAEIVQGGDSVRVRSELLAPDSGKIQVYMSIH